ncbi:MAG: hypothetical protein IT446_11565 [Phycisphaerales bacterium]|nr:hypothetical protein [Phycisphaerales bacterium]
MKVKPVFVVMALVLMGMLAYSPVAMAGSPPERLTLKDLVNHPERLPDYVVMKKTIRFGGGLSLRKGQKVHTLDFDGQTLRVTHNRTNFPIDPDECNLLEAANEQWSKLTPAQRAVDAKALITDASLWPARIKLLVPVTIKGARLGAGTEITLAQFTKDGAHVYYPPNEGGLTGVELSDTDLLARARELANVEPDKRPSRIVEELRGKLVNADGSPSDVDLSKTKIFAIYYGANWCPWCHKLSPHLIKVMKEIGPRNPGLTFVMINDDDQPSEMFKYMTESDMPWPALPKADAIKVGVIRSMMMTEPQLRIVDYYGNEIFNCPGGGPEQIKEDVDALMQLDQSGKAR